MKRKKGTSPRCCRPVRSGVSLMEVLIGTFVLSVGMLGLAALIPIGRFAIVETGKADRAGACGRAGLRELKVQRMLDPTTWWWYDSAANNLASVVVFPPPTPPPTPPPYIADDPTTSEPMAAFAIDPMQMARAAVDGNLALVSRFPYDDPTTATAPRMTRITLASMLDVNTGELSLPLARRSFVWRDELLFEMPEDVTGRPRRLVRNGTSGDVGPYPQMFSGEVSFPPGTPLVPQTDENYSWIATVTPAIVENGMNPMIRRLYSVSIVVFWKRDYTVDTSAPTPTERVVTARMIGDGYGGGDVELTGSPPWLQVKENQWLMLCGQVGSPDKPVFQWYRVISAAEADGNSRYVTLAGPDWSTSWNTVDIDNNGVMDAAHAVLLDGVIGVYTTMIDLDRDLMWPR